MNKLKDILGFKLIELNSFSLEVFDILVLIIILVFTRLLLISINSILSRLVKNKKLEERNRKSFWLLIKYFVWVISLVLCLEAIGFQITIILAGSAALLVGLGLGLQQIFADIVSGVFLLVEGTVKIGDIMEVDGLIGRVTEIKLRTSEILTRDGIVIIVPNHKFITENVVNWSHNAFLTRFDVSVGVAYGSDPEKVKKILMDCAEEHMDVNTTANTPVVRLTNFGDSSMDFKLLFWSSNGFAIENTKSELRFMIVKKFHEEGIQIPFPQRDLHIVSDSTKK
ncbi:mechanosensitive ion channel family protein [Jiulongibacter sp. NS-SX5]|uniref:mechanosensitive ion channel family protein n=1 Tax=Jiulongibacter sp. NS-SX5 TaxID=3463854 RepID=UPI0040589616